MIHQRYILTLLAMLLICSKLFCLEIANPGINKSTITNGEFACNSLLTNNGFESDLTDWTTSGSVTVSNDAAVGNKAVVINNTETNSGLWQSVTGSANEIYTLKLLAKKTGSARPSVGIEFFDVSGTLIHSKFRPITSTTYQEYSFSAMTPNNTTKVQVVFWNGQDTGEAFFDDICFEKFTVDPVSCATSVPITSSDHGVYVMDHSGNNSDTKDYDYGDIKLCDNGDGTLSIRGYVIGGSDSDWHESNAVPCGVADAWYIDLLLSDVKSWEEFQGSYVQREGCAANRADWDFWKVSGSYEGIGCNAGRTITVLSAAQNYRVQVGWGGNSHSCDFGMSTWFEGVENGTNTHSDMYFHIKEIDYETVRPPRRRNPGCNNNLLQNSSFEDTPTSTPPYWTVPSASTFSTTSNYKVTGNVSSYLYHSGSGTGQVYQQVTGILPGNNYSLSFYGGTHQPNYSHTVKIEFYNSSNTLLETSAIIEVDKDVDGNNTLDPYNLNAIAPPNTTYLRVVGTTDGDYLKLDDVCLTTDENICDNSISNSEFNNGTTDWIFKTTGNARAKANLDIDNTSLLSGAISAFINIDDSNHEISDIQLLHDDLSLISGEQYQVSFQAKASNARTITVVLQKTSDPNIIYKSEVFNLTTSSNDYSFSYTPSADNFGDVKLVFQFGGNKQEVYIDKVSYAATCGDQCVIWANSVADSKGNVTDPNLSLQGPDGQGAFLNQATNGNYTRLVWDFGETISVGEEICFKVKGTSTTIPSTVTIWYLAGSNPVTDGYMEITSRNFVGTEWQDLCFDMPVANQYVKIVDTGGAAFYVDAVRKDCSTTEICNNGIDDDGDGLVDNLDPDCFNCINKLADEELDNGTNDWGFYANATKATATWSIDNTGKLSGTNSAFIDITNPGVDPWDIQFLQTGYSIEIGKEYTLSFEAMASKNRPIHFAVQKATEDHRSYGPGEVTVITEPQTYTQSFIAEETNIGDVAFIFHLGGESGNLYIDNIHFGESCGTEICDNNIDDDNDGLIDGEDPDCSQSNTCATSNTNLFQNPGFEEGNWTGSETFIPGVFATPSYEIADWSLGNSKWVETSKATEGNKILYINSDDPSEAVCINQKYNLGASQILNDCDTYQICFDWASFNSDYPDGRATKSQPALDILFKDAEGENIFYASSPIGKAVANQDWDNLTWSSLSLNFQLKGSFTPPPNATEIVVFLSEYKGVANGLLFDNTRLSVFQVSPGSCGVENCYNGIDDDGDGLIDDADSDCTSICTSPTLVFQNPSLVNGTVNAKGAVYKFSDVLTGIDAQIELLDKSHSEINILNMDLPASVTGGYDYAFQPEIDYNWLNSDGSYDPYGERWIEFELTFYETGTNTPIDIPLATISAIDIDGNGDGLKEFFETQNFDAYRLQSNTNLTTSNSLRATGSYVNQIGINENALETMISFDFNNVNTIKFKYGAKFNASTHGDSEERLNCLFFKCYDFNVTEYCPNITISGDPSVCASGSTELTTIVSNNSGTCYLQWESSSDNTTWTVMPGATNNTLSITNLTTPTYYRVSIYCDDNSLCGTKYSQRHFLDIKNCTEICGNEIDDDGDGLTDCDDSDCPTPSIGSVMFTEPTNCPDLDNGTITITATSMNDIEYSIDGGTTFQSNGNFTGLVAAVYNVVIRDKESQCEVAYDNNPVILLYPDCKEICDNNIDDDGDGKVDCNDGDCGKPIIDSVTPSNPNNCPTLDNGTIAILATGDNLEYSIDNGISYKDSPYFTNLRAGSYTIKVRNTQSGCLETASITLENSNCTENCTDGIDNNKDGKIDCEDDACGKPTIIDVDITIPDNCPLATNGIITITASGANLVYSIDGGTTFQNARVFINLSPGSFNIVVKNNSTGCIATHSPAVLILDPTCEEICDNGIDDDGDGKTDCEDGDCGNPNISNVVGSDPDNCPILDNGEITITATGADLLYSIDGGVSFQSGNKYINLSAGTYHIQVKNNTSGCTTNYTNNPIILSDPTCEEECGNGIDDDGDGEIDLQDDDCDTGEPHSYVPNSRWLCEGSDYVFEVPVPFPNFTYSWDFSTYASQTSATGPGPHTIQFTPPTGTNAIYPRVIFTATTTTYSIRDTYDLQIRPTISIAGAIPITPSDCGATDGSVVIEVNRQADACFELSLDGGNTWELANQIYFDNLSTGSYSVVARYCDASCISEPSIVTLADPSTTTILGNDDFGGICPTQTYTNTVISNDIIKNPNVIYSIVTPTTHGTIEMDTKGSFEYITTEVYCGIDQFSYSVCDPENICCVTAIVTLDLGDKVDPILQNVPADITISCDEAIPLPALITAYDNCPSISIDKDEVSTQGLDGCSLHDYTITRSWTATDLCNNTKTEAQLITVSDITAPDIFRIYTLPNGKKLIAGVMENVYQEWKTIPFPIQFNQPPLVFTQVVTTEDITPIVTRIRNTSTTQFELKLQKEEKGDQSHARESVAWIAIEPGAQTEDYLLETGTLDIDNNWKTINFSNSYTESSTFFTSLQSVNEKDPSVVRTKNLGSTGVTCKLLEETSEDTEVSHELESMAYLAIGLIGNITDEKGDIIGETGRVSIDHNRFSIRPKNKYYNPVIITQSLTNNGEDPIVQRIDLANQASFDIQLQKWDYLSGVHAIEEVSYMIIEGSIPLDASSICTYGTDGLEIGKDFVVVDNCDPNVVLQYEEGKALSGASKQTVRTWFAEDICGNKTAYSQVINCQGMSLQLKAFLQGALVDNNNEAIMRDDLRELGLLPLEEPYSDSKEFTHVGQGGGEKVDPSLFLQTGDQAIVDWVFVELKKADNFEEVVATTSALIQRDGNVVNVDGSPTINFFDVPNGAYYIKLRHRNHLALETLYPYTFSPTNIPFIDFTDEFLPLRGNKTRIAVNGQLAAWSGDLNGDNLTVFQGPNNDVFHMFLQILTDELNKNTLTNFISRGYTNRDFNMDGTVIFQGPNNDRSVLLWNTIFNHPDNELNQSNFIVSIAEIIKDIDFGSCMLDKTQIFCDFDNDGILNGSDPDDDNDGVSDGNDIAPYNNQSDTDKDGISDNDETGNDGSYHRGTDTDPLSPCDPFQDNNICNGSDTDGDGFFSNYPLEHSKYDPNDQNNCEPNGTAIGCSCPDDDGDGFVLICDKNNKVENGRTIKIRVGDWQANQALGNECGPCLDETSTPSLPVFDKDNDGYFIGAQPADPDDNNPCIPNISSFACQQIDKDLDGYFGNADPNSDSYDLDDNNACIPAPTILCYGIDHDGDTYYGNFPQGHPLADPNDNDSCVPDVEKCPIDQDGDGYFDNISPIDTQFDPNDSDNCIPKNTSCNGCPTFQGATFICNNPGTNNEATILLEPSEDLANYSNSYCGPCIQFNTIADGDWYEASTWKNGKIPPTNLNGINVSINHSLTSASDITIGFGGYVWIKDGGLTLKDASLNLTGGVFMAVNAQLVVDKAVQIDQVSSKFYLKNSTVLIKESYLISNSGVSYFEGACVTVQGDYNITQGIEVYENTSLVVEQGNVDIGKNSTIVIKNTKIRTTGYFNNKGLLTGIEMFPAITLFTVGGDVINTGLWLCGVEKQYCIGGENGVPEIFLKGLDNCGGINVFFEDHECP